MKKISFIILMFICLFSFVSCKDKQIEYATVSGKVTYYFNKYKGNVADDGALVCLLKITDKEISSENQKKIINALQSPSIYYEGNESEYAELGLYMTKVATDGTYVFNNIPNGKYTKYVHTNHVDGKPDNFAGYKVTRTVSGREIEYLIPFSKEQAQYYGFDEAPLAEWIPTSKYSTKIVDIKGTTFNCGEDDFGMCNLGIGVISPW